MSEARAVLRDRVLEFYRAHGVRDHSLRTVAREIGSSQRMLHYHFGSREQVVQAAAELLVHEVYEDARPLLVVSAGGLKKSDQWGTVVAWLGEVWQFGCARALADGALITELASHAQRQLSSGAALNRLRSQLSRVIQRRLATVVGASESIAMADLVAASMTGLWLDLAAGMERDRADQAFALLLGSVEQTGAAGRS